MPADGERARLLQFIAHELRNPLASALWSAEMLNRRPPDDPRSARVASLALRSLQRLRALLEDVLAMERLPSTTRSDPADLRAIVEKAAGPHDLEPEGIPMELSGPTIRLRTDPGLLERLLHSAMRRAHRARSPQPIRVEIRPEGQTALVEIARDDVPLMQLDPPLLASGGSEGEGTTLSLYFARIAARTLRLALWVEPRGEGAAILLRLPVEAAEAH